MRSLDVAKSRPKSVLSKIHCTPFLDKPISPTAWDSFMISLVMSSPKKSSNPSRAWTRRDCEDHRGRNGDFPERHPLHQWSEASSSVGGHNQCRVVSYFTLIVILDLIQALFLLECTEPGTYASPTTLAILPGRNLPKPKRAAKAFLVVGLEQRSGDSTTRHLCLRRIQTRRLKWLSCAYL